VNIVLGFGDPVGATLSTHPAVDMVSFTGSTGVGKRIVAAASGTLKKVSLELGGKNPQVIFPDADLDQAADAITFGVYFNAGECCNSGSRIIVHEDVAEALVAKVVALSRKVPFGDPLDPRTQVGAIISPEHLGKIDGYVKGAAEAGAAWRWAVRRSRSTGWRGSSTDRRSSPACAPTCPSRRRRSSARSCPS
jgi:betaine-aldehyde dehydrogenase